MITIKVLGPGCHNCHMVEENARKATRNMGVDAEIIKITDYGEMKRYGLLATPGLVINEKLVCAGRIPEEHEVMVWLADAMEAV